jgi:hypothetical protein
VCIRKRADRHRGDFVGITTTTTHEKREKVVGVVIIVLDDDDDDDDRDRDDDSVMHDNVAFDNKLNLHLLLLPV